MGPLLSLSYHVSYDLAHNPLLLRRWKTSCILAVISTTRGQSSLLLDLDTLYPPLRLLATQGICHFSVVSSAGVSMRSEEDQDCLHLYTKERERGRERGREGGARARSRERGEGLEGAGERGGGGGTECVIAGMAFPGRRRAVAATPSPLLPLTEFHLAAR